MVLIACNQVTSNMTPGSSNVFNSVKHKLEAQITIRFVLLKYLLRVEMVILKRYKYLLQIVLSAMLVCKLVVAFPE